MAHQLMCCHLRLLHDGMMGLLVLWHGITLAAVKHQNSLFTQLQHAGIRLCTDRHCPLHKKWLPQKYSLPLASQAS